MLPFYGAAPSICVERRSLKNTEDKIAENLLIASGQREKEKKRKDFLTDFSSRFQVPDEALRSRHR
jgi:hypothetical protein